MSSLYLWLSLERFTIWISAFCSKQNRSWMLRLRVYIISANCGKAAVTSRFGSLQLSASQGGCTKLLAPACCMAAMYHLGCCAMVPWSSARSMWKPMKKQQGSSRSHEPGWLWVLTQFFSCGGCGDVPVTQLIYKERGRRKQLGCKLQMRMLQSVTHQQVCTWVAS